MEFLNKKAVLCISPHPDDTEYSMMGTIAQFTDTKFICLDISLCRLINIFYLYSIFNF